MGEAQTAWTVRSLLAWGRDWLARRGVDNPRLDAELLVAHALRAEARGGSAGGPPRRVNVTGELVPTLPAQSDCSARVV